MATGQGHSIAQLKEEIEILELKNKLTMLKEKQLKSCARVMRLLSTDGCIMYNEHTLALVREIIYPGKTFPPYSCEFESL